MSKILKYSDLKTDELFVKLLKKVNGQNKELGEVQLNDLVTEILAAVPTPTSGVTDYWSTTALLPTELLLTNDPLTGVYRYGTNIIGFNADPGLYVGGTAISYDSANSVWNITKDGLYEIEFINTFFSSGATSAESRIVVNKLGLGNNDLTTYIKHGANDQQAPVIKTISSLSAGDKIHLSITNADKELWSARINIKKIG